MPIQLGGSLQYSCSTEPGAVLVLGDDADRFNALNKDYFRKIMSEQYHTWLNKANGEENSYGIKLHDLILVTGCDKTSLWTNAAFKSGSSEFSISINAGAPEIAEGSFSAAIKDSGTGRRMIQKNWGPGTRQVLSLIV
ncbi:hypothetical protein M422DRAFT_53654 [Sphaerobolus stellatus SS14]|uniref:Uncharacterized protein n=1 Tax=Sphaerobolus stellatus (strain SS14) TaxID=990650 RepID=A0A0C9UPB0_SPHS4|nr:hypothetical protein M422DRAFT_53654 [Sphaerobolus stellatus SS14]